MGRFPISFFEANDEQLMWRVKRVDDAAAFARLVARWEKPIQRLCARMTGDLHRAEDLTQVAFARVFGRRADWEPAGKFSTFLWCVAVNLCRDDIRRSQRRGEFSLEAWEEEVGRDAALVADIAAPDAQVESLEREELVRRALAALPSHYREVVVLKHYEGLKFREIGEVLNIPEGTAKSRMAEALTRLGQSLVHLNKHELCNHTNRVQAVPVK